MCDWPVWGYYRYDPPRMCGNGEHYRLGNLDICSKHFELAIESILSVVADRSRRLGEESALETRMRFALRDLDMERRADRPEPEPLPETRASVVYFAEREGFVKIGTTRDIRGRMKALAAGGSMVDGMTVGPLTLLATVPGTRNNEQFFHRKFAHLRVDPKREWFLFDSELQAFVAGLKGSVLAGAA